jgi:aspartate/methionine/tyrosine aminotransferase
MSKSHALAGARIGYVVAPERVIDATRRISNHTVYNVPVAMQRVAHAAIVSGDAWLADAHATYRAARDAISSALDAIGVVHHVPRGGSFYYFDVASRLGGRTIHTLLEHGIDQGVLLAPGDAFGDGCDTWLRLCFTGAPLAEVEEGVRRFGRALETPT